MGRYGFLTKLLPVTLTKSSLTTPLILRLAFLIIFIRSISSSFGQFVKPKFQHLGIENGLSQNQVTSICQDYKGFMWFGTRDGLNRYDGYTFKVYKADSFNPESISDNHITAL